MIEDLIELLVKVMMFTLVGVLWFAGMAFMCRVCWLLVFGFGA